MSKKARANRERLPKCNPVTLENYQALINATETDMTKYNSYTGSRLRVAMSYWRLQVLVLMKKFIN